MTAQADGRGDMYTVKQVEEFLTAHASKYRQLTEEIQAACDIVSKEFGPSGVRTIYGRGTKQKGDGLDYSDLKSPEKIALALKKLKTPHIRDVTDITGITVVVHYPDQIERFTTMLAEILKPKRIQAVANKVKKDGGYYATHVDFRSNHTHHRNLYCEVQVKTMLHDAWAAKTHDLTYKPQGKHDDRLNRMMNLFADALQSIEIQSETLRDLIEERWASESGWRKAVSEDLKSWIPHWMDESLKSPEAQQLRQLISDNRALLSDCSENDEILQQVAEQLEEICEASLQEGYLLEAFFSIVRAKKREQVRARERTWQWLDAAVRDHQALAVRGKDIWTVPLVFYISGDLGEAIASAERLIEADILKGEDAQVLRLNLANHLIEHAYFALPSSKEAQADLRTRIEQLLSEAPTLRENDPTPFYDAEGMLEVSFSDDPMILRKAIDMIYKGNSGVPKIDTEIANSFFELNIRLAWRRLLDAETRKSLATLVKKPIISE